MPSLQHLSVISSILFITILIWTDNIGIFRSNIGNTLPIIIILLALSIPFIATLKLKRINLYLLPPVLLILYAAPGVMVNRASALPSGSATFLLLLVTSFVLYSTPKSDMDFINKYRSMLEIAAVTYVIVALVTVNSTFISVAHEKFYIIPAALTSLILNRNYKVAGLLGIGVSGLIYLDPRTTELVVALICLIFLISVNLLKKTAFYLVNICTFIYILLNSNSISDYFETVSSQVKTTVGGTDNTYFRSQLIDIGVESFLERPIFGRLFSGETAVVFEYGSTLRQNPLHNDFLEIAVQGGAVGLALFTLMLISTLYGLINVFFSTRQKQLKEIALVNILLLASCCTVMLFNPVINKLYSGLLLFICLAASWVIINIHNSIRSSR